MVFRVVGGSPATRDLRRNTQDASRAPDPSIPCGGRGGQKWSGGAFSHGSPGTAAPAECRGFHCSACPGLHFHQHCLASSPRLCTAAILTDQTPHSPQRPWQPRCFRARDSPSVHQRLKKPQAVWKPPRSSWSNEKAHGTEDGGTRWHKSDANCDLGLRVQRIQREVFQKAGLGPLTGKMRRIFSNGHEVRELLERGQWGRLRRGMVSVR